MRILYGVVGEGMGHAIRSRVVLEHLLTEHEVHIIASQRAVDFLRECFGDTAVQRIHGLHIVTEDNRVRRGKTLWQNVRDGAEALPGQIKAYFDLIERFEPQAVISDFESWTYLFGRAHRIPVFSIDNMQIINRCELPRPVIGDDRSEFEVAKTFIKGKLPHAQHYFIATFPALYIAIKIGNEWRSQFGTGGFVSTFSCRLMATSRGATHRSVES